MEKNSRIARYQESYINDYGFESVMVDARQKIVLEMLANAQHSLVIEVGCGANLLFSRAVERNIQFDRWIIVEPGAKFYENAAKAAEGHERLQVVHRFFEDSVSEVQALSQIGADVILCSSLLHEVPNPKLLLEEAKKLLSPEGILHVNVPNVTSFHRRLAQAMGFIKDLAEMSERNKALSQHRFFDESTLREFVIEAGFSITHFGGYMIKPFTHKQMEEINPILSDEILGGLWEMGREFPALASEIYVNARVDNERAR
jgi:2-polyprenyl-3-methyl-5-hydroxy-6-metoxy-1,4-benzoquinol methylase